MRTAAPSERGARSVFPVSHIALFLLFPFAFSVQLLLTIVQRKLNAKEERIWEAFQRLDLDGDGKVTLAEIETVLKANKQDAKKFIAEVDQDNDGCVSYEEFITMVSNRQTRRRNSCSSGRCRRVAATHAIPVCSRRRR